MPLRYPEQASELAAIADRMRSQERRIVVASGCFDLLHGGHVHYLERSRMLGDALFVLVSDDMDARRLKGAARPVLPDWERAQIVEALRCVDLVVVHRPGALRSALNTVRASAITKGIDYHVLDEVADELAHDHACGISVVGDESMGWRSTTGIIEQIVRTHADVSEQRAVATS